MSIEITQRWLHPVVVFTGADSQEPSLSQRIKFWYSGEGSVEPVRMCRLARSFAEVIYDSESAFRASKRVWYLLDCRVTKGSGESVQPCEYSPEP